MSNWKLVKIKRVDENDGTLFVMESGKEIPFEIKRVFLVSNVSEGKSRGNHATRRTRLILFPVSGSCNVIVDDLKNKESFFMDDPSEGLLIEPMVWRSMTDFSSNCVLMALCDSFYATGDETIDDYEEYKKVSCISD